MATTKAKHRTRATALVPIERVEQGIVIIRGQKVMLDSDLAEVYGTTTKALNQAVKRNAGRFPSDFMFRLTSAEKREVVTNCDHLIRLKLRAIPFVRIGRRVRLDLKILERWMDLGRPLVPTLTPFKRV